jgi:hypothetical protein
MRLFESKQVLEDDTRACVQLQVDPHTHTHTSKAI